MGLESHDAIGHVDTCFFHAVCPTHVGGFVEARFEFHHHRDLLAVLSCIDKVVDHLGAARGPVKCHFDSAHFRILTRFLDKAFDGSRKGLVGVLQQNRSLIANNIKKIRCIQSRMVDWIVRRIVKFRIRKSGEVHEVAHCHHAVGGENVLVFIESQFRRQQATAK